MKNINFKNLEEAVSCYGKENLVAIDNLKQLIFYLTHGCQPRFVWESEKEDGHITGWFLKSETKWVYDRWMDTAPPKGGEADGKEE